MSEGPQSPKTLKKHIETAEIIGPNGKPATVVSHAAFEPDDPDRHAMIRF
jgi:hypothetical protein